MKKIEILWLSMYPPVSFTSSAGSQTFNYYFKSFLKDLDFNIRLVTCGKYSEKDKIEQELIGVTHKVIYWNDPKTRKINKVINVESKLNLWNVNANMIANSDVLVIRKQLLEWKKNGYRPDTVILEWTPMVLLSRQVRKLFPYTKIIASEHDVTFIGYKRRYDYSKGTSKVKWRLKYNWEKKQELQSLKNCDLILPHNPDNIDILKKDGIDDKKMQWLVPYFEDMSRYERKPNYRDILFYGSMSRKENYLSAEWFIDNVIPLLKDLDIRFIVLGANPPQELINLESNRVHITGFVKSIEPYFQESMCMVAPLVLGAGIKVKIIEGLSAGIPILTNNIGIEGIHATSGKDYYYCSSADDYAKVIKKIYNHQIDLNTVADNARKFVEKNFSPDDSCVKYRQRVKNLVKRQA